MTSQSAARGTIVSRQQCRRYSLPMGLIGPKLLSLLTSRLLPWMEIATPTN